MYYYIKGTGNMKKGGRREGRKGTGKKEGKTSDVLLGRRPGRRCNVAVEAQFLLVGLGRSSSVLLVGTNNLDC